MVWSQQWPHFLFSLHQKVHISSEQVTNMFSQLGTHNPTPSLQKTNYGNTPLGTPLKKGPLILFCLKECWSVWCGHFWNYHNSTKKKTAYLVSCVGHFWRVGSLLPTHGCIKVAPSLLPTHGCIKVAPSLPIMLHYMRCVQKDVYKRYDLFTRGTKMDLSYYSLGNIALK